VEVEGVYVISVVSRMLEMHPQTLRKYERAGLVRPSRTDGMLRLYSDEDVRRLRLIKHLVDNLGLNLAGVNLVLRMRERIERLRVRTTEMPTAGAIEQVLDELLLTLERREETG
jgi:MerR family transcriptional regulator, heat shock protein HspR